MLKIYRVVRTRNYDSTVEHCKTFLCPVKASAYAEEARQLSKSATILVLVETAYQ